VLYSSFDTSLIISVTINSLSKVEKKSNLLSEVDVFFMIYLKSIYLENFCGYKKFSLDFFDQNERFRPFTVFFGPNGFGKSTFLQSVRILSHPSQFFGRNNDLFFRKLTFDTNYDPTYYKYSKTKNKLKMVGTFFSSEDGKIYKTEVNDSVVSTELPHYNSDQDGWCIFTDADHPINMGKFQINSDCSEKFIELANSTYNLPCKLDKFVSTFDMDTEVSFFLDFTIQKNDVTVHYKRMSDGEKKIATLLRSLCDKITFTNPKICLIDNIEMHIYFKRHPILVDKLISVFPNIQFITTSHSQTLISHVGSVCGSDSLVDLEKEKDKN